MDTSSATIARRSHGSQEHGNAYLIPGDPYAFPNAGQSEHHVTLDAHRPEAQLQINAADANLTDLALLDLPLESIVAFIKTRTDLETLKRIAAAAEAQQVVILDEADRRFAEADIEQRERIEIERAVAQYAVGHLFESAA